MKNGLFLAVAAGTAIAAASANASVVAYWNFNNSTGNSTSGQLGTLNSIAPDLGAGTLSIGGGSPTITFNTNNAGTANGVVGTFTGSTLNAIGADVAGGALSIQGAVGGGSSSAVTSNGGYVQFNVSMVGLKDLVVSFSTRGTGSGFHLGQLSYSTDGVSFFNNGATWDGGASSAFFLVSNDLSSVVALNNAPSVTVRLTLTGATGGAGNNRIDNVQLNANPIPTPGAVALLGLGGLIVGRRRR